MLHRDVGDHAAASGASSVVGDVGAVVVQGDDLKIALRRDKSFIKTPADMGM